MMLRIAAGNGECTAHCREAQMKLVRRTLAVCLSVLIIAPTASAQNHVIGRNALDKAVQDRVARDQSDRQAILSLLQRPEVREVAAKAGISLEKASAAVATLEGQDLREIASRARQVNNELAGGATIVITTTTIIIILLLVIIIIVAVD
jgi:hypothetical protein